MGNPDPQHVSTSFVERQNLTMRMSMRRFTRLTSGFSRKIDNHAHMVAIHFMNYNFARVSQDSESDASNQQVEGYENGYFEKWTESAKGS
jgi:hypothetical protein